jgi:glycosyltransferase involved in cell wall biosynthesis
MTNIAPNLGIVIPTRNRHRNLDQLLLYLDKSSMYPSRCIIVDSSDFLYRAPAVKFSLEVVRAPQKGQVRQRNHGISLLSLNSEIKYVLILDDDILLGEETIRQAMLRATICRGEDPQFVGFGLNLQTRRRDILSAIMLYPVAPGVVTRSCVGSAPKNLTQDISCDWVLGGCTLWDLNFLVSNPNDYPFEGKAYAEDLYFCSLVSHKAKFMALSEARCMHIDQYNEANGLKELCFAGIDDVRVRLYISKRFSKYSQILTWLHLFWIGILGFFYGLITLRRERVFLGGGRVLGLLKITRNQAN